MADDDIEINLDPSGYLAGVVQIDQANQRLQRSFGGVTTGSTGMQKALDLVTPGRAAIAGLTVFAAQAARSQQGLAGLAATSTVTGVSVNKLAGGIRQMAREMPLGYGASKQIVEQIAKMGVAGEGSEGKILKLSTTVAKLAGATGDSTGDLTTGMVELSRATGNVNLDPKRFENLADSLTTVSAKSGASASNILAFSKNIAPLAQASGIGTTGVLGISSAFAKLGEDGVGASTAVNKMLSDLNRSVRDGSPEIRTYAMMVGKSADEFERLFKSKPAEALTEVTEAIAKAGPDAGPRMLEQIGIEGVRGQRSIQALVASGGMRESISQAVEGYGSGSTDKAAQAAFGGLNDSLNQLQESSAQVAEAFGAPLLGPLTAFTNLLRKGTNVVGDVAGSGPVQGALTGVAWAGVSGLIAKAIMGPLGAIALGRQGLTSSPVRAAAAAWAQGTGNTTGWMARYGAGAAAANAAGTMGPYSQSAYDRTLGLATRYAALNPPTGQPGIFQRLRTGAAAYGSNALNTYMRSVAQQYTNATVQPFVQAREPRSLLTPWRQGALRTDASGNPIMARRDAFIPSAGFAQAWDAAQKVQTPGMNQWQAMTAGMREFHKTLTTTSGATLSFGQQMRAMGGVFGQTARFGGTLAKDAMGGAFSGIRKVGSVLGPGLGLTAGIMAITALKNRQDEQRDANNALSTNDISGTINAYRESIGKSADTTKTFGSLNASLTSQLATSSKALGYDETKTITDADVSAAQNSKDKVVRPYDNQNSAKEIASQVAAFKPTGVTADELEGIKIDLLRQFDKGKVGDIISALPDSFNIDKSPIGGGLTTDTIRNTVAGVSNGERQGMAQVLSAGSSRDNLRGNGSIFDVNNWFNPGGVLYQNPISEGGQKTIQGLTEGIAQQASAQSDKFGSKYALQEQSKAINTAVKEAYDKGDVPQFYELQKRFASQLGGDPNRVRSVEEYEGANKDFVSQIAAENTADNKGTLPAQLKELLAAGGVTSGTGGLSPELQKSIYFNTISPQSNFLGQAFDVTAKGNPMQQAMTKSLGTPTDVGLQENATNAIITGAKEAGKSMMDLALEASKTASAVDESSPEYARLKMVQGRAEQQMAYEQQDMTPGQAQIEQYKYVSAQASAHPTTEAQRQEVEAAKGEQMQLQAAMKERYTARLQVQREYEISSARSTEEFNRSERYAAQDQQTSLDRLNRNFNLQKEQTQHSYDMQVSRSEEDLKKNRIRAERDLGIEIARAEKDLAISRERQIRDSNIQIARAIEDAASTMYDPYTRVQTKATWDSKNLLVNMREQTDAIAKQKSQLDQLRKLGLSAQAIDQLGLGKTENAQQVTNLVADAKTDPSSITALSAEAKRRGVAAGTLYTDSSNKDLTRMRQDRDRSYHDQQADLAKNITHMRADTDKGLKDAETDLSKSLDRMATDLAYGFKQSQRQLDNTVSDMAADRDRASQRAKEGLDTNLKHMREDIANADKVITGSMSQLAEQANRAIHGKAVKWQSILKNDTLTWVTDMQKTVIPKVGGVFNSFGVTSGAGSSAAADHNINGSGTAGSSAAADRAYGGGYSTSISEGGGGYHTGGEIPGRSAHETADDKLIRVTGGEFVHNVHAVREYGTDTMHAINSRSVPKERLVQAVRGFATGGWIDPVAPVKPEFPWGHYPSGGVHKALDYAVPVGTPVHAPYSGTIIKSGWSTTGFGNEIEMLNSTGTYSILGHNSSLVAKLGDSVRQGQVVSLSGATGHATGPHVHLEMRTRAYDPNSAYDFTNGTSGLAGAFGAITNLVSGVAKVASAQATIADLFSGMKNRPGPYNQLTAEAKKRLAAQLYDQGGVIPHGGVGVNLSGKPERVLTDSQWGAISALAAQGAGVSAAEVRGIHAAQGMHIVINNSGSVTYDNRNDFGGAKITVQSQDPDDMARKLEAKKTRQRLTQTRGVRR